MAHTDVIRPAVDEPIRLFRAAGPIQPLSDALGKRIATVAATLLGLVVACGVAFSHIPLGVGFASWKRAPAAAASSPSTVQDTRPAEKRYSLLSARLAATAVVYPQTFSSIVTSPSSLCEAFVQDGLPMGPWQRSLAAQEGGECSMLIGADGHSAAEDGIEGGSVFVMVREGAKGRVGMFRMKLNLLEAGDNAALLAQATRVLATLSRFADVALPAGVTDAVANRRPVEVVSDFGSVRFDHEWQDDQRYNLSVRYARQPTLKAPAPHGT